MHRFIKFCTALWAVVLSATPMSGAEKPLIVGMELSFPPFEMRDSQGKPAGLSVDLAHALGESLGRPVEIQNYPFDGLIPALKTGRIDIILSSMTATPERAQSIDFSVPYLKNALCLLVGKSSPVQKGEDLNQEGKVIAVKKGTTGHLYAAEHLKAGRILVLDKEANCALEVAQGKADAFIYDQIAILQHWQRHRETTRALLQPIRHESWAIGLKKGNDALREKVDQFLAKFREEKGFERLGDKWLKDQKAEFARLGVPFLF